MTEKYYRCTECGYIFPDKEEAMNHWRYDVTGEHTRTDNPLIGEHLEEIN